MVLDHIEHAERYKNIGESFEAAIRFLREYQKGSLAEGKYQITEDAFAVIKRYETRDVEACGYEAHRDCIDMQYMVSGEECIGWAPRSRMKEISYNEKSDSYELQGEGELYPLHTGEIMIFFPEEPHMPCVRQKDHMPVEKIIIKIRKETL